MTKRNLHSVFRLGLALAGSMILVPSLLSAADLTKSQEAWLKKVRFLMSPEEVKEYERRPSSVQDGFWESEKRARLFYPRATAEERERVWMKRVDHAGETFGDEKWTTERDGREVEVEPSGWETQRGATFALILGPPRERYVANESAPKDELEINDLSGLLEHFQKRSGRVEKKEDKGGLGGGLGGLSLGGGLGGLSLGAGKEEAGEKIKVERWIYPVGGGQARVLTFANKSGQMTLFSDVITNAKEAAKGELVQYADANDPWFPRSAALAELGDMPKIADAIDAQVSSLVFRSDVRGAAHVRAVVALDPYDLEDADLEKSDLVGGQFWVNVKDSDGNDIDRARYEITAAGLQGEDPIVLEAPLELRPGTYDVSIVVAAGEKGAQGSAKVEVGDLESGLSLSSLVLSSTVNGSGAKAKLISAEGRVKMASTGGVEIPDPATLAFTYGNYFMVPEVDETFKADQVLVLYFQVYGAKDTTITTALYLDGDFQGEYEPDKVKATGADQVPAIVRLQPLEGYPEGEYEIKVIAKDAVTGAEAKRSVEFYID